MGYFDEAKDDLRKKVRTIFENENYRDDMSQHDHEEGMREFDFSGDVDFHVKVEDDGEYREFYVYDEDGNVVEIFTTEMVDQDGRLPSSVRSAIVDQYETEESSGDSMDLGDDDEVEDVEDVENTEEVEDDGEVEDVEDDNGELDVDDELTENERTPEERQVIDKAVQDIHTDKLQVQDVLKHVPDHLQDDVLDELRRRGGDVYPERGPDGRGAGEEMNEKHDDDYYHNRRETE